MRPEDAESLRALADLFRSRRASRTIAILDDDDQDPPGVHHGHSRRPRSAEIIPFPHRTA